MKLLTLSTLFYLNTLVLSQTTTTTEDLFTIQTQTSLPTTSPTPTISPESIQTDTGLFVSRTSSLNINPGGQIHNLTTSITSTTTIGTITKTFSTAIATATGKGTNVTLSATATATPYTGGAGHLSLRAKGGREGMGGMSVLGLVVFMVGGLVTI